MQKLNDEIQMMTFFNLVTIPLWLPFDFCSVSYKKIH